MVTWGACSVLNEARRELGFRENMSKTRPSPREGNRKKKGRKKAFGPVRRRGKELTCHPLPLKWGRPGSGPGREDGLHEQNQPRPKWEKRGKGNGLWNEKKQTQPNRSWVKKEGQSWLACCWTESWAWHLGPYVVFCFLSARIYEPNIGPSTYYTRSRKLHILDRHSLRH